MKRRIAMTLAACLAAGALLTGCGGGFESTNVTTAAPAETTTAAPAPAETKAEAPAAGGETQAAAAEVFPDDADPMDIYAYIQTPSSNPDKITIRYATAASEDTFYGQCYTRGYVMMLKWLKDKLGDRIEVNFIMNGSIGTTADAVLGNIQMGNIEMSDMTTTMCSEFTNAYMPLDLFYLVTSMEDMYKLLDGPAGELMNNKLIADAGLRNVSFGVLGPRNMTNAKHTIATVDDMKGLKMRVQSNKLHMAGMSALGASATNIAFSELFTALQQGTVDGQENPADTILQHHYYEVQKYMTLTQHLIACSGLFVNNEWYEKLPDDVKAAFEECSKKGQEFARTSWAKENEPTIEELKTLMEVTVPTEEALAGFQAASKAGWAEAASIIGEDYLNEVLAAAGLSLE